jgi:DNA-directed RNA polymerase specialized sigma24 family protein
MIHLPDGYTEDEVLDCIQRAVGGLVSNFRFGYYDEDDLRQEGFLFACEAVPRFNPNNAKGCGLTNFLRTHVRNRFLNLRRNKLHRHAPPCLNCPFKNTRVVEQNSDFTHSRQECSEFEDKTECPKWQGWETRNQAKRSLLESCDVSKVANVTSTNESDVCTQLSHRELLQYVSDKIPLALRADYCRLLEGAKLTKPRREAVIAAVREIAGELLNDETEIGTGQS